MKRLLKGIMAKIIIMMISVSILFCGCSKPANTNIVTNSTKSESDNQMLISSDQTIRLFHVDLLYRIFSYMDIGDIPSSVYSEDYINEMKTIKEQMGYTENFPNLVEPLAKIFKEQYSSLGKFFFYPLIIHRMIVLKMPY